MERKRSKVKNARKKDKDISSICNYVDVYWT